MADSIPSNVEAIVLDVGGVFLIPHHDPILATLQPHGIEFDPELIEQAHYVGVGAVDACTDPEPHIACYLAAYVRAIGIDPEHVERASQILAAFTTSRRCSASRPSAASTSATRSASTCWAAGFHPFHFDPLGLCASQDVHPHIRSLTDLPDLIGSAAR